MDMCVYIYIKYFYHADVFFCERGFGYTHTHTHIYIHMCMYKWVGGISLPWN